MNTDSNLFFVYVGVKLPSYVNASLKLAKKFSGLSVNIIGNSKLKSSLKGKDFNFIELEDFYSPEKFDQSRHVIQYSHEFREGFWLRTLERFFVLEQFMKAAQLQSLFHAELDQLLFRCDNLVSRLNDSKNQGIFVPFHDSNKAVASIFYCNQYESLESLINFTNLGGRFNSEMELIANWAYENPNKAFLLPTLATEMKKNIFSTNLKLNLMDANQLGGVVDAAQLGQWIAGIDPKNLSYKEIPKNRFFDQESQYLMNYEFLSTLKFGLNELGNFHLLLPPELSSLNIYNLHIHSKIHNWFLRRNTPEKRLLSLANSELPVKIFDAKVHQLGHILLTTFNSFVSNPFSFVLRICSKFLKFIKKS